MGCRQERQTVGTGRKITGNMRQTGRVTVSTVIFGKGSGKAAARRNVITFSQKIFQHRELRQEKYFNKSQIKIMLTTAKGVHMADIPPASVTA